MKTRAFTRRPVAQAISLILGSTVLGSTLTQAAEQEAPISTRSSSPVSAAVSNLPCASSAMRRAWSTASSPKTSASSRTPISPNRCSASAACRSTARSAKARASRFAASARTSTWCCSTAGRCRRSSTPGHGRFQFARVRLRESRLRSDRARSRSTRPAAPRRRPAASARRSTSRPRVRWTRRACTPASASRASSTPRPTTCRSDLQGDSITPEISGIFSNTFADGKFGVALTASYQERDSRLQPGGGRQRLASVRRRREQLGHDSAAGQPGLGEHHQPSRRRATRIRCRRTSATASTASSASAPTAS